MLMQLRTKWKRCLWCYSMSFRFRVTIANEYLFDDVLRCLYFVVRSGTNEETASNLPILHVEGSQYSSSKWIRVKHWENSIGWHLYVVAFINY